MELIIGRQYKHGTTGCVVELKSLDLTTALLESTGEKNIVYSESLNKFFRLYELIPLNSTKESVHVHISRCTPKDGMQTNDLIIGETYTFPSSLYLYTLVRVDSESQMVYMRPVKVMTNPFDVVLFSLDTVLNRFYLVTNENTVSKQHIPRHGERYLYADIADENLYGIANWCNDETDKHMLKLNLIFPTAQQCVERSKEILSKAGIEV